ncbi:MAG: recombinase family protein [Candidatus Omnitrophica bacterium]|nr:recombinase family protein [Candidatus Omnitrophota bacterium]
MQAKCAIYTRVSTDNQAEVEFNSCQAQEEKIKSFINSQENLLVFKVYSDAGFSGADLERPALQEMLRDIRENKINVIIVYKIDRLTRSPKDFYALMEIFDQYKVDFISITERFDTSTPSGRLLRNIMLTFAQFERELTSERTKDKLLERANKGMWNGGNVPFGYKVVDKRLVPDEQKAQKLREIFALFTSAGSLAEVYKVLKRKQVFNDKNLPFSKAHLQSILKNPVYIGRFRYSGKIYQGVHQPLISEGLFNHVQPFFRDKTRKLRLYKDYKLGGLVKCIECGSIMTSSHTNKGNMRRYYYYRCTKTFKQDWRACSTRQVNADRLEGFVIDNLKRISLDTNYIDSLIFKLNFEGSRVRQGLEPTDLCSETVQKNLKEFVDYIEKASKIEQALIMRKYIKDILYSKESIQINMLCLAEPINRQSIKNPAPLEESGVCGRARAAANPTVQVNFQTKRATVNSSPSLKMAPPRGLEPRTWWLHLTRNYFRKRTISLP